MQDFYKTIEGLKNKWENVKSKMKLILVFLLGKIQVSG